MEKHNSRLRDLPFVYTWLLLASVPLLVILVSFLLGGWSWGLMDDYGFVKVSGGVWEATWTALRNALADGRFLPTNAINVVFFYKLFSNNPTLFYIFRWCEFVAALGIWSFLAFRVTGSRLAAPFFLVVALSFYKIYDAFFFLSLQEGIFVLLMGLTFMSFLNALEPRLNGRGSVRWGWLTAGVVFLLGTFGVKETCLVAGIALGISTIIVSVKDRRTEVLGLGIGAFILSVVYAIVLLVLVMKGYSASYAISDPAVMVSNFLVWLRKDLPLHAPWLALGGILMVAQRGQVFAKWTQVRRWALLTGVFLYLGYTLILLPWSTWGHYVVPLGVFLAFVLSVLLADRLERLSLPYLSAVAGMSFIFALVVALMALKYQAGYQYDSANLMRWMATNLFFEHDMELGVVVRGNATEPCNTIVAQVNGVYGKNYAPFLFTSKVREVMIDPKTKYYLWGPHWGDQDLSRLGKMWTPMFVSEHWVLFRRMN